MVRTKADVASRAVGAKSFRKTLSSPGAASSSTPSSRKTKGDKYGGGNPYCPRPTPPWQKEITRFLVKTSASEDENGQQPSETATSSDASDSSASGSSF
ncbi:PCNA-associated factor-like [Dermacentor silvarum]|uniref:PCNA-associated factor-like n=1 Tax=Dermacentor silvarum TaxID=543639 RepID=UPI00189B161E|nr:PCNA-associated factor-like isoform X2 [Dermacentor silvarum]XP_037571040.1 PCNA-associated factor-like [Dermacentor silvarum]